MLSKSYFLGLPGSNISIWQYSEGENLDNLYNKSNKNKIKIVKVEKILLDLVTLSLDLTCMSKPF